MKIKNKLGILQYNALKTKYKAQVDEAYANLSLYFSNPVAIGEHSDMQPEYDKWLDQLTNANDKLTTLQTFFDI